MQLFQGVPSKEALGTRLKYLWLTHGTTSNVHAAWSWPLLPRIDILWITYRKFCMHVLSNLFQGKPKSLYNHSTVLASHPCTHPCFAKAIKWFAYPEISNSLIFLRIFIKSGISHTLKCHLHTLICYFWFHAISHFCIFHIWFVPFVFQTKWVNRTRVLIFSSRGISYRDRHLMNDFRTLMPHSKSGKQ